MKLVPVIFPFLYLILNAMACGSTPVQPSPPSRQISTTKSVADSRERRSRQPEPATIHNDADVPDGLTVHERWSIDEGLANISVEQLDPDAACPSCILKADALELKKNFERAVSKWQAAYEVEKSKSAATFRPQSIRR